MGSCEGNAMSTTLTVVIKIVAMFLVILIGWLARRRAYIDSATTSLLSIFTADVALPALVFTQMLGTVDRESLLRSWGVPLLAVGVLGLGELVGWLGWRLFCTRQQAPTFIFAVSIANWIYLPLPIVQSLYGASGVQVLLLSNLGAQVMLWTMGVATLHGGRLDRSSLRMLVTNPGLIATLAGIAIGLLLPGGVQPVTIWSVGGKAILEALTMVGSLTIPLTLVLIGALLGAIPISGSKPNRAIAGVVLLRLVLVPLAAIGILWALQHSRYPLPRLPMTIAFLISAMPVAVNCGIFTVRFKQDTQLAAQSIFYSTLLSIVTVPAAFWLFDRLVR